MKKLIFILVIILFSINIDIVNAVQIKGTTGDIAVTLTTVSVTMDGEVDPSINKMNIILDVYDETSKKVVAGPTTITGKLGETRTIGSIDISKLDESRNYLLRGKEASATSTGDTFEVPFNTLKKPAVNTSTPEDNKKCDIDKASFYPYGNTNDGFYKESNKPTISIIIQTINCAGQQLKLTVKELDRCIGSFIPGQNCNDKLTDSDLDNKAITIPSTGNLTLNYIAGEEKCETLGSPLFNVPDGYDCLYYFELVKPDGSKWSSMDRAGGAISYECDGKCSTDWELKSQEEDTREVGAKDPRIASDEYTLLAPIGEIKSIGEGRTLGDYINLIVTIFLGICGALAVIMIIIYGLQWMGTDSIFSKTEAKQNIGGALMGLVLALGSWMLLNTINPDLLGGGLSIGQASIKLTEDEKYFEQTEGTGKDYPGYTVAGGSFNTPTPSAGVLEFEKNLKDGYTINSINIYTNDRAAFVATKNGASNSSVTIDIGHGFGGFSEVGKPEKTKTPKGTFQVGASNTRMEISQSDKKAIMTLNGKYNLGAAFIGFNALDEKGANRGIGFHGRWNNSLSTTNGCIRMKNDDLLVLAPYMKRDRPRVVIQ